MIFKFREFGVEGGSEGFDGGFNGVGLEKVEKARGESVNKDGPILIDCSVKLEFALSKFCFKVGKG